MRLFKSALVLSALVFSVNAQAALFNLGQLDPQEDGDTDVFNLSGSFGDDYEFEVLSDFSFTSSVTGINVGKFTTALSSGWGTTSFLFGEDVLDNLGGSNFKAITFDTLLTAGKYTFNVAGIANTTGAYTGNFTVGRPAVTAVPEPESYAMFLAGLGLLGFVSRRKTS